MGAAVRSLLFTVQRSHRLYKFPVLMNAAESVLCLVLSILIQVGYGVSMSAGACQYVTEVFPCPRTFVRMLLSDYVQSDTV